eukprot:TRINITY_DN4982_c0_g2_i2.p1 TRINITY_DN4982_c0_g2~~TRINITY_DN4982_c0_g2_i2.p1  ORF type:complete len:390 (+),score=73.32 TRINITY_DN4982_c0_g2_i2:100-1170(+)
MDSQCQPAPHVKSVSVGSGRKSGWLVLSTVFVLGMSLTLVGLEIHQTMSNNSNSAVQVAELVDTAKLHEAVRGGGASPNSTADWIIPPIIHQSWKSTVVPSSTKAQGRQYPYRKWIQSWTLVNANWTYMFWTDEDNNELFQTNPLLEPFRESYKRMSGVVLADYARYAYLYVYGGVYADIDFECLKPFAPLAQSFDLFLSSEPTDQTMALSGKPQIACNAIMGSRPMHPFWLKVLNRIKSSVDKNDCRDPVDCSGPRMLQKVYEEYVSGSWGDPVTMLPSQYFYPELAAWNDGIAKGCERLEREGKYKCKKPSEDAWKSFAVHHWACQWCRGHNAELKEDITAIIPKEQLRRPFDN